ncbi:MAG: DUF4258 domain-containing protein [Alphaproteobacteria bacterium]|nr:DUF4258 domain-containing protein [Alphaproteobacteria bacterium]
MSEFLSRIMALVRRGEILVSRHGFRELAADDILLDDITNALAGATVVEEYPDYAKGRCILVLELDRAGNPIHVLWGIAKGRETPAVLITAYRPQPDRWSADFLKRVQS